MKNTQGARMTTNTKLPTYWAHTFAALLALTLLNGTHAENYVPYGQKFKASNYQKITSPQSFLEAPALF